MAFRGYCMIHNISWSVGEHCTGCADTAKQQRIAAFKEAGGSVAVNHGSHVRRSLYGSILNEATSAAEKLLPHGIELVWQRNESCRTYDITATCPHCEKRSVVWSFRDDEIEAASGTSRLLEGAVMAQRQACAYATCCDPADRYVDGLRVRDMMANYERLQREGTRVPLSSMFTPALLAAVRSEWSRQLRLRQEQAREAERVVVTVDGGDE